MELTAAIRSLEYISESSFIEIYTDSQYVKNGITQWVNNWIKNNWKNMEGKPVKNQDLWLRLLELAGRHKISWNWVRGHSGHEFNELVDALARKQCGKR
jgi:ribonuclease HI